MQSDKPFEGLRFNRAKNVEVLPGRTLRLASAEDIILSKLQFYKGGGSEKHVRDILGILSVQAEKVDTAYIDRWSMRLGVLREWEAVRARAGF